MSKTIKAADLISIFQQMFRQKWSYEAGAAREGCVDCSGAFSYAYSKFGKYIMHGSNSIARKYISGSLLPIAQARPGYAAFKVRDWDSTEFGNAWYRQEPGDLYHIGLVDEDGTSVLNAKGTKYGFCSDPLSKWDFVAPLSAVEYDEVKEMETIYQAIVNVSSGKLNVRKTPSVSAAVVCKLAKGTTVNVVEESDGWAHIQDGIDGWCSAGFLKRVETPGASEDNANAETVAATTTFLNTETGGTVTLVGDWCIAVD